MEIEKLLIEIGLTESEKKVYLTLLELGDSTRGELVDKSGIAGSKIYEVLHKLQEKGLAAIYIKNNVKHFKSTNPNQILYYLEKKKKEVLDIEEQARKLIPSLLSRYTSSKEEQEVELLIGLKGLEIIFREQIDLLQKGDTCYVIGGTKESEEGAVQSFFEKIHLMREQKGIKTKMLFNLNQREVIHKIFSAKKYRSTTTKYIDHHYPVAINVYKDRTAIIIYGKSISAILIKSQDVASSFLEYFDILWKSAKN